MQACHTFFLPGWQCGTHAIRQGNLKAWSGELVFPGTEVCGWWVLPLQHGSAVPPDTLCSEHLHREKAALGLCFLPPSPSTHQNSCRHCHQQLFLPSGLWPPGGSKAGTVALPQKIFSLGFLPSVVGSFQFNEPPQKVAVESIRGRKKKGWYVSSGAKNMCLITAAQVPPRDKYIFPIKTLSFPLLYLLTCQESHGS